MADTSIYRTIEDVKASLKHAKESEQRCSLLVGAGCSVTAGIPDASEMAVRIQKEWSLPPDCSDYRTCMERIGTGERRKLIAEYVSNAKVNWAHICIAQLMKSGYVDVVLSTNFDPLVVRTCALLGMYPAVYDLGASVDFDPSQVISPAVIYLHGQHVGIRQIHTTSQSQQQVPLLKKVTDFEASHRYMLVVGYSGRNDEVFEEALKQVADFSHQLHWISYSDEEAPPHLSTGFLGDEKMAFLVRGFDADRFFIRITQEIGCFPPALFATPFTHLAELLDDIVPWPRPDQPGEIDVAEHTRGQVSRAIRLIERPPARKKRTAGTDSHLASLVLEALMRRDYEKAINLLPATPPPLSAELAGVAAYAYGDWASSLQSSAEEKIGREADEEYESAYTKFAKAEELGAPAHVFNNWAIALSSQAKKKSGDEAEGLLKDAYARYAQSWKMERAGYVANNWGLTLIEQARNKPADEQRDILGVAEAKLMEAEEVTPGISAYNMACVKALLGDKGGCRAWLENAKSAGTLPSLEHVRTDPDLDLVRHTRWFKLLLSTASDRSRNRENFPQSPQ